MLDQSRAMTEKNKLRMDQPFKILIDIWGVITSWDFAHDLRCYLALNIADFLERNWNNRRLKDFVQLLRDGTTEERKTWLDMPEIAEHNPRENNLREVIQSVIDNIDYRKRCKIKNLKSNIGELEQSVWSEGYRTKRLLVHVFPDVRPAFERWTAEELSIKIYSFASGSSDHQKLFLSSTIAGDLRNYVISGINSFHRYKYDPKRYKQIFSTLLERHPKNILYLTDEPKKANAAISAGLRAVVVLRYGNSDFTDEDLRGLSAIDSLDELDFIAAN